jgi:hypothetical protein
MTSHWNYGVGVAVGTGAVCGGGKLSDSVVEITVRVGPLSELPSLLGASDRAPLL